MMSLSRSQKIYAGLLLGVVTLWLALKLGIPVYEYLNGRNALTVLLAQITTVLGFAVIAIGAVYTILQRIGVLPTVAAPGTPPVNTSMKRLRNLVLWIVIALLLVLLFNLVQPGHKPGNLDAHTSDLIVEFLPLVLIGGIWIFFMMRMNAKKKKDLGGNS